MEETGQGSMLLNASGFLVLRERKMDVRQNNRDAQGFLTRLLKPPTTSVSFVVRKDGPDGWFLDVLGGPSLRMRETFSGVVSAKTGFLEFF